MTYYLHDYVQKEKYNIYRLLQQKKKLIGFDADSKLSVNSNLLVLDVLCSEPANS